MHRWGSHWLGRDAMTGAVLPQPHIDGIAAWTTSARRYGLHATLKAPFKLASGATLEELREAVAAFAADRSAFEAVPLVLESLGGFMALVPARSDAALEALAAACVTEFDRFRAPSTPAEIEQRRKAGLSAAEDAHLLRWGYPYVLDAFRFHVTLTDRLQEPLHSAVRARLVEATAPFCERPWTVDAIALFEEPSPGAPFQAIGRYEMTG